MFFKKSGGEEVKQFNEEEEEEDDEETEGASIPSTPVISRQIGTGAGTGTGIRLGAGAGAGAGERTGLSTDGFMLSLQNFLTSDKFKKKSSPSFKIPLAMFSGIQSAKSVLPFLYMSEGAHLEAR